MIKAASAVVAGPALNPAAAQRKEPNKGKSGGEKKRKRAEYLKLVEERKAAEKEQVTLTLQPNQILYFFLPRVHHEHYPTFAFCIHMLWLVCRASHE